MTRTALFTATVAALVGSAPMALGQTKATGDSLTPRFSIGSTQMITGFVRFRFPELDSRIAAAGLPRVGGSAAGFGLGTDLRMRRLLIGGGFQTLLPRAQSDELYRSRMSGSHTLADLGYALVNNSAWSVYPLGGVGVTHLSLSLSERGEFTFDEGLRRPARKMSLSGTAALLHAGLVIEHRFRRGDREYAMSLRGGITRSVGRPLWLSEGSTVDDGPSGIRSSYLRVSFSRPIRRRTDGILQLAATALQAVVR
jgi:hypothetical protein